ncbi:tripartite tricarboxylate transporter TctB family protein [Comamonas sp. BIGb0124]|uniref:tripartite tricarboxylate transporter TctB family protein n=1 Tax=Comamonas sp. BIGb0124 TaxID=2485130 RepID=UPI000F46E766|nr:tripartite tricarboxylate transporter TctB family protein [Comamonas sp. BIGb0124]ROR22411.1 tripartite tricarboxylate transporter TctB family protein [Comamonas sp. BIGb0124]
MMNALRRLLNHREVLAGLFVLLLGLVCLAAVGDLDIGSASEMGPGYVPRALAWMLIAAGTGMALVAALRTAPEALPALVLRPLLVISLSVLLFGAMVDRLGIVLAVVVSTAVASLASPISRRRETPLLCAALAALSALAFVKGLGLAIPIWPR